MLNNIFISLFFYYKYTYVHAVFNSYIVLHRSVLNLPTNFNLFYILNSHFEITFKDSDLRS